MTSVAFHIDQLFSPAPGGIGTYVRELGGALLRQDPGLELRPFHARLPEGTVREPRTEGGRPVALPQTIRSLYPMWDLLGRPPLPPPLASADVVHATNPAAIPPAASGQRLVVTVHDVAFERFPDLFPRSWRWLYRAGLRAAVKRADAILTPSRNTAEDLLSRTNVSPERLHVVPLAASLESATAAPGEVLARLKVPAPYVLFVGTLEPRKNLVRLVRAYRRLAGTGLPHSLVLAGPMGWSSSELLRELALEGPGDIVLTGGLAPADLDAVYRGASAFVYPSIYEGFGLPVLEAMARGVPAIVSSASSIPEVAGDAALAVDPGLVTELAEAVRRVLVEDRLAADLAERGRERAALFSWDETARRTLQVYEKGLHG
jgi:glycosyltransferase involved in cell wall biosynthesis